MTWLTVLAAQAADTSAVTESTARITSRRLQDRRRDGAAPSKIVTGVSRRYNANQVDALEFSPANQQHAAAAASGNSRRVEILPSGTELTVRTAEDTDSSTAAVDHEKNRHRRGDEHLCGIAASHRVGRHVDHERRHARRSGARPRSVPNRTTRRDHAQTRRRLTRRIRPLFVMKRRPTSHRYAAREMSSNRH